MRMPPPTNKEEVTMEMVMGSLPDIQKSCLQMTITWHLGRLQPDMVSKDQGEGSNNWGKSISMRGWVSLGWKLNDPFCLRYL